MRQPAMLVVVRVRCGVQRDIIHDVGDFMRSFMRGVRLRPVGHHAKPEYKENAKKLFHGANLNNSLHSHPIFEDICTECHKCECRW